MSVWWVIAGIVSLCKILGRAIDDLRPPDAATIDANIRAKKATQRAEKATKRRARKAAQRARKAQRAEEAKVRR